METIQIVLSAKLLKAADLAAKRCKIDRSALIRNALRDHLKHLRARKVKGIGILLRQQLAERRKTKLRIVKAISQSTTQFRTGRYEGPEE